MKYSQELQNTVQNAPNVKQSVKSVLVDQGIPCGVESCSEVSAAFVYHANTKKTVLKGKENGWKDYKKGPWEVAYVEVLGKYPHNVAYNQTTQQVVDLSLGQFIKELEEKVASFVGTKEYYLNLIKGTNFKVQKYTVPDTLDVLYKTLIKKQKEKERVEI